ncbi:acyl carrier protein [Kitasatospora sp. NBC_01560]|uniref:acyl carrier protein n=1 Tax=Kitasatospora sp. NBC_01560 TaxID=2975965 RepID=UPI00386E8413
MNVNRRIDEEAVRGLLAAYRERPAVDQPVQIDSIELAWLIHQVEQAFDTELDLDDDQLARMSEVSGAAAVLAEVLEVDRNG